MHAKKKPCYWCGKLNVNGTVMVCEDDDAAHWACKDCIKKLGNKIELETIDYGFRWGPLSVTRLLSDPIKGYVVIGAQSKKQDVQIYCTKTGKITVTTTKRK